MIAPTHMGFGAVVALLLGAEPKWAAVMAIGSLLPDLDARNSIIARMTPGARRIFDRFGHREFFHSLILWMPLTVLGWILGPLAGWLMAGALSHCFLDTATLNGVKLFWPSEKVAVFGPRNRRIKVGSTTELVLLVVIGCGVAGLSWVHYQGGWRLVLGLVGSYDVAIRTIERSDGEGFEIVGDWKLPSGDLEESQAYLVVGWEATRGVGVRLALWDPENDRILRPYENIIPVYVRARPLGWQWGILKTSKPVQAVGDVFFRMEGQWFAGRAGDTVIGVVKWRGKVIEAKRAFK